MGTPGTDYPAKRDVETLSAKLRNKLTPYWNLVAMIERLDSISSGGKKIELWSIIKDEARNIKERQDELLKLVDSTLERHKHGIEEVEFHRTITEWLVPNGYVEVFSNHPLSKDREWHFSKDGVRVICVMSPGSENYCYLHKDISITPEPVSLRTSRFTVGNNYVIEYLHKFMLNKSSLIEQ